MSPDLALLSTLTGSNYPCLEQIFMVPKVFEPSKFNCSYMSACLSGNAENTCRGSNCNVAPSFSMGENSSGKEFAP